jgi:signal transduction histidine kinase
MLRRISTKLVLAVLAAVCLPFLAFALVGDYQVTKRLRAVVDQNLEGVATGLAGEVERFLAACRQDVELWARGTLMSWAKSDVAAWSERAAAGGPEPLPAWGPELLCLPPERQPPGLPFAYLAADALDDYVRHRAIYELLLLADLDGRLIVCNRARWSGAPGELAPLASGELERLFARDCRAEPWFAEAASGRTALVDWHASELAPAAAGPDSGAPADARHQIGIAAPVFDEFERDRVVGVLLGLVGWSHVEELVGRQRVAEVFRGYVGEEDYPSAYAWIWKADCDTIIGHPQESLHGRRVSEPPVSLPQMRDAALASASGMYPEYRYAGVDKVAAFAKCAGPERGGLGWLVGVGINQNDIYGELHALRRGLFLSTGAVLLVVLLWTMVIARRTTRPILELREHAQRVAGGDLEARVEIQSGDELGALSRDFNDMTRQLKEGRERLVRAEKDAAWREMARQIAHDIKNPLTPMRLSLDLLERARAERSPDAERILEHTLAMVRRQVEHLREIATEFYEFTGGRRLEPRRIEIRELVDEVLALEEAEARESGVTFVRRGPGGELDADPAKLRRVLQNLVGNALAAMRGRPGELVVDTTPCAAPGSADGLAQPALGRASAGTADAWLKIEVVDGGSGLTPEARAHLFEPYFTTKSEGTGLGLAIARRAVEEHGGTIELVDRGGSPSAGTIARVLLPRRRAGDARAGDSA